MSAIERLPELQSLLRSQGMCGEASPNGERICVLPPAHPEPHPWNKTANAVERLRLAKRFIPNGYATYETEFNAALAAVEALYQAAVALDDAIAGITEDGHSLVPFEDVCALAAAVHQVEA